MTYLAGDARDQLAHVGVDVVRAGLVVGSGGNLSARTPDDPELCWVTSTGSWLDRLARPSFARVRIVDGAVLSAGIAPTSELTLHLTVYRARPDVGAVVHLHPQTVLLLDALGERIRLVTTDHMYYLRRVAAVPFAPPGSVELAELAAGAMADGTNCVVLSRHGCSVAADTVELAHKRARYLEEAALLTYRVLALPGRLPLRDCPASFQDLSV